MADQPKAGEIPTGERMADIGSAMLNAVSHKLKGEHETEDGARYMVDPGQVQAIIENWPEAPRRAAETLVRQYGPPNEATPTKLFWYRNGPWKRTILTSDIITHNFPATHSDFLTQYIDYHVPPERFDDIGRYDGSCLVDRTAGEVGARCDSEAANTITLNLMHEIVTGAKTIDEAREAYAQAMSAYMLGRSSPYAERLQFELPKGGTEDPDKSMMAGAMARQTAGKVKDALTGSE